MKIDVTRTEVVVGNGYIVNKGEYKINPCEFTFSEEYTAELVKKAVFDDGKTEKEMAIINNKCDIPYEVLDSDSFVLRVYAYQVVNEELELIYSPTPATVYLREGSYRGVTGLGEVITATQFEQYEQALNDGLDDLEAGLQEVSNVDIDVSKSGNTATVTITDRQGTEKSVEIFDGDDYVLTEEDKQEIINTVEAEVSLDIPTKVSQLENDSAYINKEVNNLTNYYKKNETYTKTEVDNKVSSVYKYRGTVATYNDLPSTNLTIGDVYNVESDDSNYAWNGTAWDKLGGNVDLSNYYTKSQTDILVNAKYTKPSGGIPKSDLTSSAQTSLEKADTAVQDVSGKEDSSNKVTSIDENSTDTQYPSAKTVYDNFVTRDEEINQLYNDHPDITDTGTDLTLNGTGDLKMKVDVGGNSTQVQYEGYNLLPNTAQSQTISGVTFTVNDDKTILVNGTASAYIEYTISRLQTINFEENEKIYLLGCPTGGSDNTYTLSGNSSASLTDYGNGKNMTVSAGGISINGVIKIKSGTVCNNLLFKPMVISGNTKKSYEPYVGGTTSPNPTYKQDINNVEGDVVVISKNSDNTKSNTVTFPLSQGQKLMLGDTLEDDGIHHKRGQIDLSTITFSVYATNKYRTNRLQNIIKKPVNDYVVGEIIAEKYLPVSNDTSFVNGNIAVDRFGTINLYDTTGTPSGILEYALAEETIEAYTSAQQTTYNKLKEMQSYYDLTYVVGSSDNAQPILTVQAKKSLKVINDEISNINSRLTLLEE